ncbi:MAG: energy transducer TonB [Opitutae bacterium]|nr:energy transducer TonB [Opitutae bacterium]
MHHYPRYVIPGFTAAALHAVLLFGFTPVPKVRVIEIPLPPPVLPPLPPDTYVPPPASSPEPKVEQVRPLRGEPAPPDIVEPPPSSGRPDFPVPPAITPGPLSTDRVPSVIGDPTGAPDGRPVWERDLRIFSPNQLDNVPRAKVQVAPDYPVSLRQSGAEGTVLVEFDVDATGRVVSARVLRSTEHGFEEATLRAVLKWRFEPGRRNGRAVPFRMSIPVDFRLGAD